MLATYLEHLTVIFPLSISMLTLQVSVPVISGAFHAKVLSISLADVCLASLIIESHLQLLLMTVILFLLVPDLNFE